jgi:hypothetical protein
MKKLAQATATLMLAAVVLTGCGGDKKGNNEAKAADPCATQSSVRETDWGKPATGPLVTGTDRTYSYRVPNSWADITKRAAKVQPSVDSAASEKAATDGFADNIDVGFQRCDRGLDLLEDSLPNEFKLIVKNLEVLPRVTVDGTEALHVRGPAVSAGTNYFLEQFAALKDGRIALITFSFGRDLPASKRDAMVSSVMASWKWTP